MLTIDYRGKAARLLAVSWLAAGFSLALPAEIALSNPGIPARETATYQLRSEGKTDVTVMTTIQAGDAGRQWYEVHSRSSDSDVSYRVDAANLGGFWSDVTEKSATATIRRTSEILSNTTPAKADELVLSDFNSIATSLRGFPWGKTKYARLVFVGAGASMGGFSLELNVVGKENVKIGPESYECWKLTMGLNGIFGGLVPKTHFWYLAKAPNYLVRFEGSTGAPGSPVRVLELQSYSTD